jgi:hypothetical protein
VVSVSLGCIQLPDPGSATFPKIIRTCFPDFPLYRVEGRVFQPLHRAPPGQRQSGQPQWPAVEAPAAWNVFEAGNQKRKVAQ